MDPKLNYGDDDPFEFRQAADASDLDEIRRLFMEYAGSLDIDLEFQKFDEELGSLPGKYAPPDGRLILALVDGKPAGCIALRKISGDICEMKRLYVRDDYKGLGLGKRLVSLILEEARKQAYSRIRLDTLSTMEAALALYDSFGFYDIEPYIYNPIAGARYLERELKAGIRKSKGVRL